MIICFFFFIFLFFFFNDTATTEIYTLSLHVVLPIYCDLYAGVSCNWIDMKPGGTRSEEHTSELQSREISYAVFCLKKKKNNNTPYNIKKKKKKKTTTKKIRSKQ